MGDRTVFGYENSDITKGPWSVISHKTKGAAVSGEGVIVIQLIFSQIIVNIVIFSFNFTIGLTFFRSSPTPKALLFSK